MADAKESRHRRGFRVRCHLHGGEVGFDKVLWSAEPRLVDNTPGLTLRYLSKDGEEGYPGNLNVTVTYWLGNDNSLKIEYHATTDQDTPVNLEINYGPDRVRSYVGLRETTIIKDDDGHLRFALNGKGVFHFGALDQGWWPDGLLTPTAGGREIVADGSRGRDRGVLALGVRARVVRLRDEAGEGADHDEDREPHELHRRGRELGMWPATPSGRGARSSRRAGRRIPRSGLATGRTRGRS
ncbi:MAG TPA: hypothetical protein VGD81_07430 [Opitutaceae bacterium]